MSKGCGVCFLVLAGYCGCKKCGIEYAFSILMGEAQRADAMDDLGCQVSRVHSTCLAPAAPYSPSHSAFQPVGRQLHSLYSHHYSVQQVLPEAARKCRCVSLPLLAQTELLYTEALETLPSVCKDSVIELPPVKWPQRGPKWTEDLLKYMEVDCPGRNSYYQLAGVLRCRGGHLVRHPTLIPGAAPYIPSTLGTCCVPHRPMRTGLCRPAPADLRVCAHVLVFVASI